MLRGGLVSTRCAADLSERMQLRIKAALEPGPETRFEQALKP